MDDDLNEQARKFRVYRTDIDYEPFECVGEYDSVEEVLGDRRRLDRRYKVQMGRKFMTLPEFEEWAKSW